MRYQLKLVQEFQQKFHQAYDGPPRELPASIAALRKKLTLEEAQELVDAIDRGELHEQLDACIDLIYVALGTLNLLGLSEKVELAFWRVHLANMDKELAPSRHESKRDSPWDIIKPEGWTKAYLKDLVKEKKP